jgi:hypothetical protein
MAISAVDLLHGDPPTMGSLVTLGSLPEYLRAIGPSRGEVSRDVNPRTLLQEQEALRSSEPDPAFTAVRDGAAARWAPKTSYDAVVLGGLPPPGP